MVQPDPFTEFRSMFTRSAKGNLHARDDTTSVTIFPNPRGEGFKWCIYLTGGDGPQYGPDVFATETEALEDLFSLLCTAS